MSRRRKFLSESAGSTSAGSPDSSLATAGVTGIIERKLRRSRGVFLSTSQVVPARGWRSTFMSI